MPHDRPRRDPTKAGVWRLGSLQRNTLAESKQHDTLREHSMQLVLQSVPGHRTRMICRTVSLILFAQLWMIGTQAQGPTARTREDLLPDAPIPFAEASPTHFRDPQESTPQLNRRAFVAMSAAVFGFAFLDVRETMSLEPGLIEHDPLVNSSSTPVSGVRSVLRRFAAFLRCFG
jgi:hypothetical protein